jgi:hypothetical protein
MSAAFTHLVQRRDLLVRIAKVSLVAATCLWLIGMALYDRSVDRVGSGQDFLLTSRGMVLLAIGDIERLPIRRIWGGPWTLFGVQCVAGTFGTIGVIALIRARLNRGRVAWLGIVFLLAAVTVGSIATTQGASPVYPATIDRAGLARVIALVDARAPGAIARLRAGTSLDLPVSGGGSITLAPTRTTDGQVAIPADIRLLRDRADGEGLRFLLAQQAYADGDMATLRRLLPVALALPPTDRPARNDFARRLVAMGAAAGEPAVPPRDTAWVSRGLADWQRFISLTLILRHIMQACLVIGLLSAAIAYVLRRRVASIAGNASALLAASGPAPPAPLPTAGPISTAGPVPPAGNVRSFGRRRVTGD